MGERLTGRDQAQAPGQNLPTIEPEVSDSAFHSQLHYPDQLEGQRLQYAAPHDQRSFEMGAVAGALPQVNQGPMSGAFGTTEQSAMPPFQAHQSMGRGLPFNPAANPGAQAQAQQHYLGPQFSSLPQMPPRQAMQMFQPNPYQQMDPYAFGVNPMQMSSLDPRLHANLPYGIRAPMSNELARRASEPAPVPSFPRGPPRKPKQSGHALWVGNLPPNANVSDLKDHFSRDATKDIESLFLISKSNCAFVNYKTEAACVAAMNRFHDSRFNGVRLVCRLRRGSTSGSSAAQEGAGPSIANESPVTPATPVPEEEPSSPTIVTGSPEQASSSTQQLPVAVVDGDGGRVPERFLILKSLTTQDLESSVRNGTWATQSHNEKLLNEAYENADNVYLIFSANKSGEYFGYARMTSTISGEPLNLSTVSQPESAPPGTPQSIITPATATAPRGRIIDDTGRGTIFWEAEHSDTEEADSPVKSDGERGGNSNWGRQFSIEWISTARLPFYRTRGLRNPWNANREIKIARDGTELEPSVGRRLIQMFHRPPPPPQAAGQFQ